MNKSALEMDRIRAADAVVQEKLRKEFVPKPNHYKPVAYFEIGRYDEGPCIGLFCVYQMIQGNNKKPVKKVVAEGVDMVIAMSYLETALRKKVFR